MNSKSFFVIVFLLLAIVIGVGINSTFNLIEFFSNDNKDNTPVFRDQLSIPREDRYKKCDNDYNLPVNAFWYDESKCKWDCLPSYKKSSTGNRCIELTDEERIELEEIKKALDAQNGAGPAEEADPSILKEGVLLNGITYFAKDINNRCYLTLPSAENLTGYNLPLKMTCDGIETSLFNLDCIGRQYPVEEGILLNGDIQCLNDNLSKFFNWCRYEFKEEGLFGHLNCPEL